MDITTVRFDKSDDLNVVGQSHFIKTVEDPAQACVPGMKFGIAFNEASGPDEAERKQMLRRFGYKP